MTTGEKNGKSLKSVYEMLREKTFGCEFCNEDSVVCRLYPNDDDFESGLLISIDINNNLDVEYNSKYEYASRSFSINYCPMCGRKLVM